jgi:photosystem II stability/assembly factor-like uncharacterized protein
MSINPINKEEMYALTYSAFDGPSMVYRSTDEGKNWKLKAILNRPCFDIALDPSNPDTLFLLSAYWILKSTDKGKTWEESYLGDQVDASYGEICITPNDPDRIYVAGSYLYNTENEKKCMAIIMSKNGGKKWKVKKFKKTSETGQFTCMTMHPEDPTVLYSGGYFIKGSEYHYRFYKTTNAGQKWKDITGIISSIPEAIAVDTSNPDRLYVATNWNIFRSADGGKSWAKNARYAYGDSIAVDPINPNVIYVGHDRFCLVSTDGGHEWTSYSLGLYGASNELHAVEGKIFNCATSGIFSSISQGMVWTTTHKGLKASVIDALKLAPSARNIIYVRCPGTGFFKSQNRGRTWKKFGNFDFCESIINIAVSPQDAHSLYALSAGG